MSDLIISPPNATACVIFLHGCNEYAADYRSLVETISLPVKWVIPQAPLRPVTMMGGESVPAWFDVGDTEDAAGLARTKGEIEELIATQVAEGIPEERIILAGFSMGAAAVLYSMLKGRRLAGYVSLSGWVPLQEEMEPGAGAGVKLFLGHGDDDDIIDEKEFQDSLDCLERCGIADGMSLHRYPGMGHERGDVEVKDLAAWIAGVVG